MTKNHIVTIFGGTGDLTYRKLLPAFYNLMINKALPESFKIVIIGRRDLSTEQYHENLIAWLREHSRFRVSDDDLNRFLNYVEYFKMVFTEDEGYGRLKNYFNELDQVVEHKKLYYFAVDPSYFMTIANHLNNNDLSKDSSIIIEKPFGNNLEHAKEINYKLKEIFEEENIFRIDHYIAKEMVQNILTVRSGNALFKNIWNKDVIDSIQISAAERVGVENRGNFYDVTGALKDMVQSHMLQILSIVTMDMPEVLDAKSIHQVQEEVLENLFIRDPKKDIIYGQYDNYINEPNVDKDSKTETYVAIRFEIDNDRWRDVPIFIRTGKKLKQRSTEITLQLKSINDFEPNQIVIKVQPEEGIYVKLNIKTPGTTNTTETVFMDFCQSCDLEFRRNTPEAYERLLDAALRDDQTLFASLKQVILSWEMTENIIELGKDNPLHIYPQYSNGPKEADLLLARSNTSWFVNE